MKIAAIGDIHLSIDSPRLEHTLEVLDWTISDARARGVTHWVLAGDTHEGDPTPEERLLLVRRIANMAESFGPYHKIAIVEGNHEEEKSLLDLGVLAPYITIASGRFPEWREPEAVVLFVPYPRRNRPPFDNLDDDGTIKGSMRAAADRIGEAIALAAAGRDKAQPGVPLLVFGHFTIESMTTRDTEFELHRADEVVVPVTAFQGCQFVAVGHIHQQQEIIVKDVLLPHLKTGDIDDWLARMTPQIVGLGGLVRHSRAEADDPKSYTVVTVEGGKVTWERVPVPARGIVTRRLKVVDGKIDEAQLAAIAAESVGQELSLTVEVSANEAALVSLDDIKAQLSGAASVTMDRHTTAVERVRAPELSAEMTPEAELRAYLRAIGQDVDDATFARLTAKIAEVPAA